MDVPRQRSRTPWRYIVGTVLVLGVVAAVAAGFEAPTPRAVIPQRSVRTGVVERGPLVRSVRGPGTLVAERKHWLTSTTAARVERVLVEAGAEVEADTILIKLRNADLELAALEARSELAAARAELANLEANRETDRLGQESAVAQVRSEHREAVRVATGNEALASTRALNADDLARGRERAEELTQRLGFEKRRLVVIGRARRAQAQAQRARVEQLAAVVDFRDGQLADLEVRAGSTGVLQEVSVELGQWAQPGTVLAKVVQPDRLKAELRIPQARARDLRLGQVATVDLRTGETTQVAGTVSRIDPVVTDGNVVIDVRLQAPLPGGARPDLAVDGVIELERLDDVLFIPRPPAADAGSVTSLFVMRSTGDAVRRQVELGRAAIDTIEVVAGLETGDEVIVSDVTAWQAHDEVRVE